jgi:BioD-like phosphotransacetylase family protein
MADEVREMFEGLEGAPVMVVGYSTHEALQMIIDYTPKLNIDDKNRVMKAVEHYEPFIDFDQLLHRVSSEE